MMTNKPELKTIPRALDPNQKLINLVREVLKDAKEGKIHALGIAVGRVDDGAGSDNGRCTETVFAASDGWHHTLATAVNGMAFRLNYERYSQGSQLPVADMGDTDE
jgi:hypothetical protein